MPPHTGIAQLVERRSPKPQAGGSSPSARATFFRCACLRVPKYSSMESIKQYLIESYNELVTKVTWPNWEQLQSTSVVVIVASLILALIIFLMDLVSKGVLDGVIYNLNA